MGTSCPEELPTLQDAVPERPGVEGWEIKSQALTELTEPASATAVTDRVRGLRTVCAFTPSIITSVYVLGPLHAFSLSVALCVRVCV